MKVNPDFWPQQVDLLEKELAHIRREVQGVILDLRHAAEYHENQGDPILGAGYRALAKRLERPPIAPAPFSGETTAHPLDKRTPQPVKSTVSPRWDARRS